MKRKIITVLAVALSFSLPSVSYAATDGQEDVQKEELVVQNATKSGEEGIQPFYDKTLNISAGLKISGNTASAIAHVTAKRPCHLSIVMRLQRKEGNDWHTIVSWVGASDDGFRTLNKTHTLTTRGTYRVYAMFDVDGEKLEYVGNTATY
ncbi:hypothetical protein AALC25_04940 [Lachnospiraceae bacterium 29-84]